MDPLQRGALGPDTIAGRPAPEMPERPRGEMVPEPPEFGPEFRPQPNGRYRRQRHCPGGVEARQGQRLRQCRGDPGVTRMVRVEPIVAGRLPRIDDQLLP